MHGIPAAQVHCAPCMAQTIPQPMVPVRPPVLPVSYGPPNPLFGGMEAVWNAEFAHKFSYYYYCYHHVWYLCPMSSRPSERWMAFMDSAKVRFCCQECGHGWTSMKGRVAYWFHLNLMTNEGFVTFKLYGQQCQRCATGKYESAMWYPEEVTKVMLNVYTRAGQVYYGFHQPQYRKSRRPGKPRTPHNTELCQACSDGVCTERR